MRRRFSLARRTVLYLVAAQFFGFFIGWTLTIALALTGFDKFEISPDELAAVRVGDLVRESITKDAGGEARIEPTAELRDEMKRTPHLKIAAFEFSTKRPASGSSPELVATLLKVVEVNSSHAHFVLPGDPPAPALGFMAPLWTQFGFFHVATYRQQFRWDDIFYSVKDKFGNSSWYFAAALVISTGAAWFAVTRALSPLRVAASRAARIDMNSLNQQLPSDNVPEEIGPLVDAINAALERLDAGVARQKRFTANAAHELRTPLAILRSRLDNAKASSLKAALVSDASQLRIILEEMLVAARLNDGQLKLDQTIDLKQTVRQVASSLTVIAMNRNRFIDFEADSTQALTSGNQRAIESVVTNLVNNALRAEPEHGSVHVEVKGALVSVVDHGEGVAPELREMIFEPFWRKDETTPGTGLGLAIAKEIMDAHGGRIWVEETPGGGATFNLYFKPHIQDTQA